MPSSDRRNYRIESEILSTAEIDGATVPIMSHSYSVYELTCTQCGAEFSSKGIMGGIHEIMHGQVCPKCSPSLEDMARDWLIEQGGLVEPGRSEQEFPEKTWWNLVKQKKICRVVPEGCDRIWYSSYVPESTDAPPE